MGTAHAAGWSQTPATIVGFVSRTPNRAEPLAEEFGARVFPTLDSLLPHVDVVDICVPTHRHYELAMQAAAAGKHVICEKPLARTLEQGKEIVAACKQAGVKLFVGHVVRFFPEFVSAREAVLAGEIGEPAVVRLSRETFQPKKPVENWFLDREKSGGILLDLMIHDFDYAHWVAGEVTSVFAKTISENHPLGAAAPGDHGIAILTHASGAITHVEGSWAYPAPSFRTSFEIAGSKGLLQYDSAAATPIDVQLHAVADTTTPDIPLPTSPLAEDPYVTEIKAFYEAIEHDAPVPGTAEDGLAALKIALAALESAQRGEPVSISSLE
jgi:predicted dehydrogenase